MHALLHARLKVTAFLTIALAVTLPIAARQTKAQRATTFVPAESTALFSDFDSDDHPDEIEFVSSGTSKSISVHLSHSPTRSLFFDSEDERAGTLLAADIDSDQDLDLIWITPITASGPSLSKVWLGDGHGNFEIAPDPDRYLNAVAAIEASRRESQVAGGDVLLLPLATTNSSVAVNSASTRVIEFTSPSVPDQRLEVIPQSLDRLTYSERGPPLLS